MQAAKEPQISEGKFSSRPRKTIWKEEVDHRRQRAETPKHPHRHSPRTSFLLKRLKVSAPQWILTGRPAKGSSDGLFVQGGVVSHSSRRSKASAALLLPAQRFRKQRLVALTTQVEEHSQYWSDLFYASVFDMRFSLARCS